MEPLLIVFNIIFLLTCLSISYLFKTNYPKEINDIIGYRTKRSMSSKEAWLLANSYSSEWLFKYSLLAVLLQIILFIIFDAKIALLVTSSLWIVTLFITIIQTEIKLKRFERQYNFVNLARQKNIFTKKSEILMPSQSRLLSFFSISF